MEYRNLLNFILSLLFILLLIFFVPLVNSVISALAITFFVIKLAEWLTEISRKYFLYKRISPNNKVILITGCDTGFGNILARRMDKLGYSVLATCLNPDGEGPVKLSQECSEKLTVLPIDITDEQSIHKVKEFTEKNYGRNDLWAVVNNAGTMHCGHVEWTSVEEFQKACDVNTFGALRVTKAFLPLIKQSKGRIVNITSTGVFSTMLIGIQLAEWLMTITRRYILWETVSPKNKAILITGCDTGFGNALARKLDKLGYTVFATCLDPNGEGAKNLLRDCSEKIRVLPMNVTQDQSIQQAKELVEKNLGQNVLWAVVNNAGIAHAGQIDWTSVEEIQQVYNVNAAGTLRVTKCFLPFLKKSKGRIVNVTSHGGRHPNPGFAGYCMSKSAAIALTTGLRVELAKWGVKAISIEPFFYATKITDLQAVYASAERAWKSAPKEIKEEYGEEYIESFKKCINGLKYMSNPNTNEVVDCLEDAVTAKEPLSTYSPGSLIFRFLYEFFPSCVIEYVQRTILDIGGKPLALTPEGKKNRLKKTD